MAVLLRSGPCLCGRQECFMLDLKDCCLTAEKVCMLVWPVGTHVLLFSNLYECAPCMAQCLALVAVPCLLQGGALLGIPLPLVFLRRPVDDLFWSGSVMRPGASVVGTACSRLPVPNHSLLLGMRASGQRWRTHCSHLCLGAAWQAFVCCLPCQLSHWCSGRLHWHAWMTPWAIQSSFLPELFGLFYEWSCFWFAR